MMEAAGRIFGDPEAAMPLIEQLVCEQATQECRSAIAASHSTSKKDATNWNLPWQKLYCLLLQEDPEPGKWRRFYSPQREVSAPAMA